MSSVGEKLPHVLPIDSQSQIGRVLNFLESSISITHLPTLQLSLNIIHQPFAPGSGLPPPVLSAHRREDRLLRLMEACVPSHHESDEENPGSLDGAGHCPSAGLAYR
jgi:hypothetical protein